MKRTFVKLMAVCLTLLMTLPMLSACGGSGEEIVIGAIGPLTGGSATYGTSVKNGIQIAVDEINEAGGVNGVKLKLEYIDDEGDPAKAKTAFENLMDKGMDVLIGCVTSGPSVAINDLVLEEGILQITPSASQKEAAQNPNSFRLCFTDPLQGTTMAEYAYNTLGYRKAAVVYNQDDSYSTGILETFRAKFTELGGTVVVEAPFSNSTEDFSAHVTKIQDAAPDYVLLPFYNDMAAKFLTAAAAKSMNLPLIGSDGMDGILNYLQGEDAKLAEGLIYLTPFIASDPDEKIQKFVATYTERHGDAPDQFAADGYDCVYVVKAALEKAGVTSNEIDNAALIAAMKEITVDGLTGSVSFDENGEPLKGAKFAKVEGGKYVAVQG